MIGAMHDLSSSLNSSDVQNQTLALLAEIIAWVLDNLLYCMERFWLVQFGPFVSD